MKFFQPTKTETTVVLAILANILSTIYLISKYKSNLGLIVSYSVLIGSFSYLSGWIIGRSKEGVLDFLKILVPASAASVAAIWLLSSGYFNIKSENLKKEIYALEKKDSLLQRSITNFKNDSIHLSQENDSLYKLNQELQKEISKYPEIKIQNKKLSIRNEKLTAQNKLYQGNLNTLISYNEKPIIELIKVYPTGEKGTKATFKIYDIYGNILGNESINALSGWGPSNYNAK